MAYCGMNFPVANPSDSQPYVIDFINDLPMGQTIESATVTLTVYQGTDPDPNSHLLGSQIPTQISGTQVTQIVGGLVAGNIYSLNIVGTSSTGSTLELYSLIPCEPVYS